MDQTQDRDGGTSDAEAAFADPAFETLKARGAPFAVLRLPSNDRPTDGSTDGSVRGQAGDGPGRAGEILWANAAAAALWGAETPVDLARALLGAGGRGGWVDGLARGLAPGGAPRLVRAGLGLRGLARMALIRAWTGRDGATLIGLAVWPPEANPVPDGADPAQSDPPRTDPHRTDPHRTEWRRAAWTSAGPSPAGPEAEGTTGEVAALAGPSTPDGAAGPAGDGPDSDGPAGDGHALARRGQLAVLRDRLGRALDGATALRMLWRTEASGAVASIDAGAFARLGSPLRLDGGALSDAVAPFDPDGAGRLRAALSGRATFAGVSFDLPVADAAATVPMALSGSPVYGPGRSFAGFRGFGTIDLGRLALAERRPSAPPSDDPAAYESGRDASREAAREAVVGDRHGALPAGPAGLAELLSPDPAVEAPPVQAAAAAPAEPVRPANVVHFRALQDGTFGRFGLAPAPIPAQIPAQLPGSEEDGPAPEDRGRDAPDDEGHGDRLAFLALGEALRARIGAQAVQSQPPGPPEPSEPPESPAAAPAEADPDAPPAARAAAADAEKTIALRPAALLLDRLPAAVLATVGDRLVFANPAAAARLGHADPGALLAAGGAVVRAAAADRIALRDARGVEATLAARRVEVPWAGESATLWLLTEAKDAAPASARGATDGLAEGPASATGPADDRSVELLDRVDDAVALLDGAGRLRRLNRRGEGWFGREAGRDAEGAEAAPGRGLDDLLAPESRSIALALLGEVRDQREGLGVPPLRRDVVARTAEGAHVPMLLSLGRLGASGFYATLRDASAAPRADADRGRPPQGPTPASSGIPARDAGWLPDLLAKVSHEIRTPLGAILGFAEVMMDERFGPLGNPRYRDYMRDIHAAGAQVVALVEDLLDLSRVEAGQLDLDVAAVDINRVVAEAVAQMQPEAHRGRVIVRTSLGGRVPSALVDERSARQIVGNLLSNAVKFNEPGGQVIVSTAPGEGGGVLLRVRDTGVGMSDGAIAAAMEPFGGLSARAPAQLGGAGGGAGAGAGGGVGGNGLGLPLTRALVGANGASMTIRSRPREGTLVEVSFAAADEGGARRPA